MPYTILIFAYRKPGLSPAEFKSHYETRHIPLLASHAGPLFPITHTRHYIQRTEHGPDYAATVLVGTQADFGYDAFAELVFEDEGKFRAFFGRVSEPEAAKQIAADEEKFLDRGRMRVVVGGEVVATSGGKGS